MVLLAHARAVVHAARRRAEHRAWRRNGCPNPPPHSVKVEIVRSTARFHGLRMFVETGTYLGDMVAAVRGDFAHIWSIELDAALYARACRRFARDPTVTLLRGDSGALLPGLLRDVTEPALFWLDGHYSGGNTALGDGMAPILAELRAIGLRRNPADVVLIDDSRCFANEPGWPTRAELRETVREFWPDRVLLSELDILHLCPPW